MHRTFAFLAAVAVTALSVSTSCFAGIADGLSFTLQPSRAPDRVQLSLRSGHDGRNSGMSSSFAASQLRAIGIEPRCERDR